MRYVVCQAQMSLERQNYPAKLIIAPCPWQPVSSDFLLSYPRRPPSSFLFFSLLFLFFSAPLSVCLSACLLACFACLLSNVSHQSQETYVNLAHQRYDTFSLSHIHHGFSSISRSKYHFWTFHLIIVTLLVLWLPIKRHVLQVLLEQKRLDNASFRTPFPKRLIVLPRMLSYFFWVFYMQVP